MKYLLLAATLCLSVFAAPGGNGISELNTLVTSNVLLLPANKDRGYLIVQNLGTQLCQIKFTNPITGGEGFQLTSGQNYEPINGRIGASVYAKCGGAGGSIESLEVNF